MSMELWTDEERSIPLGQTLGVYQAFAEIMRYASDKEALGGVLTQCELQEPCGPEWLEDVRREAADTLKRFGKKLSEDARNLLANLAEGQPE